jgi:hypothetical protein
MYKFQLQHFAYLWIIIDDKNHSHEVHGRGECLSRQSD